MKTIGANNVVLLSHFALFRQGLAMILTGEGFHVSGSYSSLASLPEVRDLHPRLLLIDWDTVEVEAKSRRKFSFALGKETRVVALVDWVDRRKTHRIHAAGANGIVLKQTEMRSLLDLLKQSRSNGRHPAGRTAR